MSEEKKLVAFVCMGEHSRASTLNMTNKQRFTFDRICDNLKKFAKDMGFNYDTIEISIMEKIEDGK